MKKSRILAVILSLAMVFSMAGISGFNVSAAAKLNKKKITISVGQTVKLKVKKNSKKVKWKSSNKKIVTVSKKGKIKGKKVGKATITAKIGKKKLKCKVKVVAKKTKNDKTVKPANPSQVPAQTTKAPNQSQAPVATTKAPDKPQPPVTTKGQDQPQTPAATTKGQDQPQTPAATTKSQEPATTAKPATPDDGKPSPKEVFGQNILNKKGLQVTFTWGSDEEIINSGQVFNIYYDGVAGEQGVAAGVITHTFETEGEHSIVIKGSLNGKESQGVELKVTLQNREPGQVYWAAIPGEPADTYYYDDNTDVSVASIQKPEFASETGIYMSVLSGIESVTINGQNAGYAVQGSGVIVYLSALTKANNTITIKHADGTSTVIIKDKTKSGTDEPDPTQSVTTKKDDTNPTQPATTKKDEPGQVTTAPSTDGAEWVELKGDPENANTYFYDKKTMNLNEIVNIQQPSWAAEKGIYMNVSSGISEVTVNGLSENVGKIEGAGVIIYLSALTREINEVSIKHAQGTGYVKIKNAKASGGITQPTTKAPAETTKSQEPATTAKPTTPDDGKPSPKEVFGQNILNKKGLQVTFTWGSDEEIINSGQVFNIYYDGVAGEQGVAAGVITHTFETEGEHSIVIKGSLNGKESQGVELKVTLQNREPGQVTTAPSTDGAEWVELKGDPENANTYFYDKKTMNLNEIVDIQQPGWAAEKGIYMNVASGISEVTVNGLSENVGKIEGAGVLIYLSALTKEINEVSIKHALGTGYVKIRNTKASGGVIQPTTKVPEATQPATTKAPQPTTKKNDTTQPAIDFTTDSSIAKPFGMQVEAAGTGYLRVVWGRGDIDCYNVYVDGERRRTGVSCGSFTLPVYTEGTHTVAVATVVGNRESVRVEETIAITGVGERETEPETCPEELKPQLKDNVQLKNDKIAIELNNKTNGKYSDNEIYWCIVGKNANNQLCYLDKDGNMIPASESLNTVQVGNDKYANIYHTLAEADYVYAPTIESGRMYISYGKPVYLKFVGTTGYAGPDLNNPGDVNANTLFEFAEFTIEGKFYWGNTTRVDYFCFPMITRLVGSAAYGGYDKVVGDIGTRDEIFNAFKNEAPEAFKTLVRDDRIIAPCKSKFNVGEKYGNYFDNYINEFWNKYSRETLQFSTEAGNFTGRVVGNQMQFTRANDSTVYTIDKPTTQDVLEGKGAFDKGNGTEKAIEAQLCAAFNRGVATEPDKYYKPSEYYKNSVNNFYAGFFHRHSVLGFAYGFCYDDVNDQSTLLQYNNTDALVIDLKW
ncbi:beta-1,3-glucanase family protein [uncultured Eubacterium sp.]|uniref:glycoside hydrolase family 64 protein n=1 Tax=uncultured Eubacterium sp. TaxID=165185 RepID=UPI002803BF49|nr:beta-1,3-glucanase family protein [uncultured Eubacterium sp.]